MNQSNWSTEARSAEVRKCFDSYSPTRTRMPAQWKLGKTVKFLIFGGPLGHINFPRVLSSIVRLFFGFLSYRVYWASWALFLRNRTIWPRDPTCTFSCKNALFFILKNYIFKNPDKNKKTCSHIHKNCAESSSGMFWALKNI